ncbi:MAG: cupin domain-containing protein [Rubrivivax sp.]|nr:cupin domain-containing protein [Rubrivivax sp.]
MKKSPPSAAGAALDAALDADLVAELDALRAPADEAGIDHERNRVRHRLLQRIAADSTERHLTLPATGAGWQPFGAGLAIKVLHEAGGVMSYLLRLDAGAALPPHRHPVDEECLVLEGEVCIGALRIGPGGYHLGRRDVLHDRLHSPGGALIFLRGAVPEAAQLV